MSSNNTSKFLLLVRYDRCQPSKPLEHIYPEEVLIIANNVGHMPGKQFRKSTVHNSPEMMLCQPFVRDATCPALSPLLSGMPLAPLYRHCCQGCHLLRFIASDARDLSGMLIVPLYRHCAAQVDLKSRGKRSWCPLFIQNQQMFINNLAGKMIVPVASAFKDSFT